MSKISYSEYELQVLMAFLQKMEKREDAIISFVGFGHSKANWEEKTNYREPSLKEKYEKAFKSLVVKGDIYRPSEDEYACDYTKKELKQKIKEYQKPKPHVMSGKRIAAVKIEDIDQINAPTTSGIAFKNKDSDDDDDDDLFLSIDDDDDKDDNNELLNILEHSRNHREQSKVKLGHLVTSFIEKKEGYDPIESSFSPHIRISYPDGTPFVFQYIEENGSHYFTDNGLLKRYLISVTKNLPQDIAECWVDDELDSLADDSSLTYEDGVMFSNLESSSDEEALNGEISYFVKVFENYFTKFYKRYENAKLTEAEESIVKSSVDAFLSNIDNECLIDENNDVEDSALELLTKIVMLDEDIKRTHAINIAERLINISKNGKGGENLNISEKLLEIVNSVSDMEFKILQKAVERILN